MSIWVLDFKSSTGVYDEYLTQVSIYTRMARNQGFVVEHGGVLRLDKQTGLVDDPAVVEVTDIDLRAEAFIKLREYYGMMIEPHLTEKKMDRFYPCDGDRFATVTTIQDLLKKIPGQWYANMTLEYFKEHLSEMTTPEKIEYHFKKAKTYHKEASKKAMDIGSLVHDKIHAFLSGVDKDIIYKEIESNQPLYTAFLTFEEWAKKTEPKPIALETILLDKQHRIGGTVDFIGHLNI